jgi:hypothetical protein
MVAVPLRSARIPRSANPGTLTPRLAPAAAGLACRAPLAPARPDRAARGAAPNAVPPASKFKLRSSVVTLGPLAAEKMPSHGKETVKFSPVGLTGWGEAPDEPASAGLVGRDTPCAPISLNMWPGKNMPSHGQVLVKFWVVAAVPGRRAPKPGDKKCQKVPKGAKRCHGSSVPEVLKSAR